MSQDSWNSSWPQQNSWAQEGKGKKGKSKDWGKGQHSKTSYGGSGSPDGAFNNYYSGYNVAHSSGKCYSSHWWPHNPDMPAEMPSWTATMVASAMEMAITGSMKDIAVNVASKWAKLVSNVVMKMAAGAMKSAILGESDTEVTTTAESSQKSSSGAAKEPVPEPTGTDKELDGNTMAKHLLQELKKTSHHTGKSAKRCRRLSTSSSESGPRPGPKTKARTKPNEHNETELKQQVMIESLLSKVQQLERYVQTSNSDKQKAMADMLLGTMRIPESQRRDEDAKNQQTKIERLQEKSRSWRREIIASSSVPGTLHQHQRDDQDQPSKIQHVPHPDTDALSTLPMPAAPSCIRQGPTGHVGAGNNSAVDDATQADDDCSFAHAGVGAQRHVRDKKTKSDAQRPPRGFQQLPQC